MGQEIDNDVVVKNHQNQKFSQQETLLSKRRHSVYESRNHDILTAIKTMPQSEDPSLDVGSNKKVWNLYQLLLKDGTALESKGDYSDEFL